MISVSRAKAGLFTLALAALPAAAAAPGRSPDGLWSSLDVRAATPSVRVTEYRGVALDLPEMTRRLSRAPMERTAGALEVVTLPMPDGTYQRFAAFEVRIMEAGLAERYPEIRTYRGQGLDDPAASCALDVNPRGFHAQVLSPAGRVFVEPAARGSAAYVSYFTRDAVPVQPFRCLYDPDHRGLAEEWQARPAALAASGANLRTYRLALACTVEYSVAVAGASPTKPAVLAEMVTAMNRINQVYEQEVAIRMTLIANNDAIIYVANPDPYTNNNGSTMLGQNQSNVDSVIGSGNYDIGHVFSTGGGGVAYLGVVCEAGWKAGGVTGLGNPTGDAFWIDFVAHEMGHQWGGDHTFNGTTGACGGGNREATSAYEPGSGSTIMAYAGICGAENLQPNSDPYFHSRSFDQIVSYSTVGGGTACGTSTATGNGAPTVNAGASYTIPMQTPFTLTGSATDPNGDALTYCWEEYDLGTAGPPNTDAAAARPIFRSFDPVSSGSRTFPRLTNILNNSTTIGESMSQRNRTMTFRLTARDNRAAGGGVNYASTTVAVTTAAGPFTVTAPTTGAVWNGGTPATVTWNVAGTTAAPVSCANVSILLSVDGGNSFPTTLAASTPNDGTETITVPTGNTSAAARVRVACVGNIFFDISNPNFTINPTPVELQGFQAE